MNILSRDEWFPRDGEFFFFFLYQYPHVAYAKAGDVTVKVNKKQVLMQLIIVRFGQGYKYLHEYSRYAPMVSIIPRHLKVMGSNTINDLQLFGDRHVTRTLH